MGRNIFLLSKPYAMNIGCTSNIHLSK